MDTVIKFLTLLIENVARLIDARPLQFHSIGDILSLWLYRYFAEDSPVWTLQTDNTFQFYKHNGDIFKSLALIWNSQLYINCLCINADSS